MLTVIGDVHGKFDKYVEICKSKENTVQIGDMGFNYAALMQLDPRSHWFFGGNHDNYDIIHDTPHDLGHWGYFSHGGVDFFFARGAFSVDFRTRIVEDTVFKRKSWWEREELDYRQMQIAFENYAEWKPDVVLSHTCPASLVDKFSSCNISEVFGCEDRQHNTELFLEQLWLEHQPKLWVFGHFHTSKTVEFGPTTFRCVNELETFDIEESIHDD